MTQYEIWWAALPGRAGERPVLLLSRPDAYGYLDKFVVAEITATIRGILSEVQLGSQEGLRRLSVANCDNLRTVSRSWLVRRLGAVEQRRQNEVKRAVGYALAWDELMSAGE